MPKILFVADHLSVEELRQRYLRCERAREARRWQAVWLCKEGRTALEVSQLVGASDWSVCSWVAKYNEDPEDGLFDHRAYNRSKRLLTEAQEAELARLLETDSPPDGGCGRAPKWHCCSVSGSATRCTTSRPGASWFGWASAPNGPDHATPRLMRRPRRRSKRGARRTGRGHRRGASRSRGAGLGTG